MLGDMLLRPNRFFLEVGQRHVIKNALEVLTSGSPHFAISLKTGSAFNGNISEAITLALEHRFFLGSQQRINISTCLQEAIANAIIHGNLSLGSPDNSVAGFSRYYDTITARLQQEPYGNMRINIAAWWDDGRLRLSVTDQGKGFKNKDVLESSPTMESLHGRGLFLIRSLAERVWIGQDNKTLFMHFTP